MIGSYQLSTGGLTGTISILSIALKKLATGIILARNYSPENIKPSDNDFKVTRKIKEADKMLDIGFIDHIILSSGSYYSFQDDGLIQKNCFLNLD